jgi:hypothetical protein
MAIPTHVHAILAVVLKRVMVSGFQEMTYPQTLAAGGNVRHGDQFSLERS